MTLTFKIFSKDISQKVVVYEDGTWQGILVGEYKSARSWCALSVNSDLAVVMFNLRLFPTVWKLNV